ncbi:MAG TPA: NAD-dependent epimerase/dehydratase family protein [Gaiellaceae bacterium]|nr:NAD-dependent epimerase/dehydratase family protein [Gaiellaceae bacterium]
MSRILVTGGAGFIGSHLADALLARGDEVSVLDNLHTGLRENVPVGAELVIGDVADAEAVLGTARSGFDAVLHVAGQASISRSFDDPGSDLAVNVSGTLNVLRACRELGIPRLVFASSMTVYGEPEVTPTPESAPCRPVSYYGVTKYAAEGYVQISGALSDVPLAVTSLRMFNVYGERQSLSNPYQGVLAIFLGNLLRGEPLTIHSDGRQTRDFVYVGDAVAAWLAALDSSAAHGQVFNVGSGRETSIGELADAVLAANGESRESWPVRAGEPQRGDQRRSLADTSSIERVLGWRPTVSLTDGMERTAAWARTT